MDRKKRVDAAWLYAAAILLALAFRLTDHKTSEPFVSTVGFGMELTLEAGMLLAWLISVRRRLLPSPWRVCIVASALLFLFFLAVSTVNYRIADQNDLALKRFCWYLYYIPLLFTPALFLITCLGIARGKAKSRGVNAVLLCAAGVLFAFVITNDLHYLVFKPHDPALFYSSARYYSRGPVYYIGFVIVAAEVLSGAVRLAVLLRKRAQLLGVLIPVVLLPFYGLLSMLAYRIFGVYFLLMPQYSIFCIVCFLECCIRLRLIPYNENYTAFFRTMRFPAVITDAALSPVFRTAAPVEANRAQLRAALDAPLYLTEDLRLSSMPLKAGNVFYTEDESELNRMNERLTDANELLQTEQTLIRAETELQELKARTESRSRIYTEISKKTSARQRAISRLLDGASPDAPDFQRVLALASIYNVWIKRSANLLLVNEGEPDADVRELTLALEETARYLVYLGVKMEVSVNAAGTLPRALVFDLYETFETITEASLPGMTRLFAAFTADEMRLVADAPPPAVLPETPLPVTVTVSEGLTYFGISAEGGEGG